jgi:hypothetical protein
MGDGQTLRRAKAAVVDVCQEYRPPSPSNPPMINASDE